jgi:RHS repeat-associated protein
MSTSGRCREGTSRVATLVVFPTHRERDDEGSLLDYRARSYDPRVGRFAQKDPIVEFRMEEQYLYVANSPQLWLIRLTRTCTRVGRRSST